MKALRLIISTIAAISLFSCGQQNSKKSESQGPLQIAEGVISRTVGSTDGITLEEIPSADGKDCYEIDAKDGKLLIKGSSPSAICYAFNKYLRYACGSMVTWGGENLNLPETWPDWQESATSPYKFRRSGRAHV